MTLAAYDRYIVRWTDPSGGRGERDLFGSELTVGRTPPAELQLADPQVSGRHVAFRVTGVIVLVEDLGSRNGTYVNGQLIAEPTVVRPGDQITIGGSVLELAFLQLGAGQPGGGQPLFTYVDPGLVVAPPVVLDALPRAAVSPARLAGVVPDELLAQPIVSEAALQAAGVEVILTDFAALGAGIGNFVWVDLLRNAGVPASRITVVGVDERPYEHYARLCRDSQIPLHERLRSNSDSCPDNPWGFPGYAVREAWHELARGNLPGFVRPLWQIFGEPAIAETYTPRSGDVFASMDREAARIGWAQMLRIGRIRAIRKSEEGHLLAVVSESDEHDRRHVVVGARFLHFAPGYPALQFLPDLGDYREREGDRTRVVNAYEPHDHIYAHLRAHGGTVVLRGRGIVASRVLQRLWEERRHNRDIAVVHLNRTRITQGHRFGMARREARFDVELQPFNWPKACWGGELRQQLERADDSERKRLLDAWGGTSTAKRSDWLQILEDGTRDGWYRPEFGTVDEVKPTPAGKVATRIKSHEAGGGTLELVADYIIDCTGLVAAPERSPLIADLIETYGLARNALGRLKVTNDFELEGLRHGDAHCYVAGAITLGGPFAAVDSFLGLQYAALRAADQMQQLGAPDLHRLNGWYSFSQWLRWARRVAP